MPELTALTDAEAAVFRGVVESTIGQQNPRQFGAEADGTTDDHEALVDYITSKARYGSVIIPPGTYALSAPIDCRAITTKLDIFAYGAVFVPTVDGVSSAFIFGGDLSPNVEKGRGWSLRGATITRNGTDKRFVDGVVLDKAHDYLISHNIIHYCSRYGVNTRWSWRGEISGSNNIQFCYVGVFLEGPGGSPQILCNSIRQNEYAAILLQKVEQCDVRGNVLESNPYGIKMWDDIPLAGGGPLIDGMVIEVNYFEANTLGAIDLFSVGTDGIPKHAEGVRISGNLFHADLGWNAIRVGPGAITVARNTNAQVTIVESNYRKAHVLDCPFRHVTVAGDATLPSKYSHVRINRTDQVAAPPSGTGDADYYAAYMSHSFEVMPSPSLYAGVQGGSMRTYAVRDVWNRDISIIDPAKGLVLRSPDGSFWRIAVDNTGALSTASVSAVDIGEQFGGQYE